nr:MAG TPA: dCTP deaminase dUTPase [Caudoviricetes sp.]
MILTDKSIRKLVMQENKKVKPLIENFKETSLQSESYDLSIGNYVYYFDENVRTITLDNQQEIDSIYHDEDISIKGYTMSPGEYILISLDEMINLPDTISAHIRPRTRFTRLGLIVSDQHCNSSYSGNLKLGLYNATKYAITIKPGIKIAQIVFDELKEKPSDEKLYRNRKDAAYQDEKSFLGARLDPEITEKAEEAFQKILGELRG